MLDENLFRWAPVVAVLPGIAFLVDWLLTVAGAKAAAQVRDRWSVEGSYEMNPVWAAAVDRGAWVNWRILLVAALIAALMGVLWLTTRLVELPAVFALGAGMMLLVQAPTLMNHAGNLAQFRALADKNAASGQLTISRRLALSQVGWLYLRFAVLWLVLSAASLQAFFLGGAIGCLVVGVRFWRLSRAARRAVP